MIDLQSHRTGAAIKPSVSPKSAAGMSTLPRKPSGSGGEGPGPARRSQAKAGEGELTTEWVGTARCAVRPILSACYCLFSLREDSCNSCLKTLTIYRQLQPFTDPLPRGIFSPEALQKPACPPKPVGEGGSRSVTPNHGKSRLITGFSRKKRLFIFLWAPQIKPNQPTGHDRPHQ